MFGNNLAIGVSLILRDAFTTQANQASAAMGNLNTGANNLTRNQAMLARNTNAVGAAIGVGLVRGIGKAYKEFADFNYTMRFTALAADNSTKALDRLQNKALEVGKRTIFSSKEVAEGMKWFAQAGMDSNQIIASIDAASNLAAATKSQLGGQMGAADILAKTSTAFKYDKTPENMNMVADILGVGANESLTDLTMFAESMKYAQNTAMRLKIGLKETTAAIMVLSDAGLQGSIGGTTFENMSRYLANAAGGKSKKQNQALAMLGLSPNDLMDAKRNLLPLDVLLGKMATRTKGLGTVDRQNITKDLFGVRGAKGDEIITSLEKYNMFMDKLNNSKGYASSMTGKLMDSPLGAIDQMKSAWESLKIQFGATIAPMVTPLIRALTAVLDLVSTLGSTQVGKALMIFGTVFIVARTAQMAYRAALLSINLLQGTLSGSMTSTAARTTSSFGMMTTAANAYSTAVSRIKMALAIPHGQYGAGRIGQFSNGRSYQVGPGGGYIPLPNGSYKPGLSKFNNFMGKYGGAMAIGGMAASAIAGDNPESKGGKALGVVGDTLGMAGTGAMMGSMFGPVGTGIGALVGGIGGLLYSLNTRLNNVNADIDAAKANESKLTLTSEQIKRNLKAYSQMKLGDRARLDTENNISGEKIFNKDGTPFQKQNGSQTTVILQLDGRDIYNKTNDTDYIKEMVDLGIN